MSKNKKSKVNLILFAILLIIVTISIWQTRDHTPHNYLAVKRSPERIMGTISNLIAVVKSSDVDTGKSALDSAESRLRNIEVGMSVFIDASPIARFNSADAGVVDLNPEIVDLLLKAREYHEQTDGAFDITVKPIIQTWKKAVEKNELPTPDELKHARNASNWNLINFGFQSTVQKVKDTVMVDLGGIAKGYAIDQAISEMQKHNIEGGLVDIGGDLRCFGMPANGDKWKIDILNPFDQTIYTSIEIDKGAVATSGNYYRFFEIDGIRYSHIIDPRTGMPADIVPSVTVVADDAVTADVWATALSVLGKDYILEINKMDSIEVMMISGTPDNVRVYISKGFESLIIDTLPESWRIIK